MPCWRTWPDGDQRGELVGHADRAAGQAAADRLGEADDVGRDAEQLGRAAGGDGRAGLDLVEDQHRAVVARELAHALEVAVDRRDDVDVHHRRLQDHAGDLAAELLEQRAPAPSASLNGTTRVSSGVLAG